MKSPYRATLGTFSRALGRETHVLTRQPELLWQQLHNRLQWEGKEAKQSLASELARLVGIDFGPLVVTAAVHDHEMRVRCPTCQHRFPVEEEQRGSEMSYPDCGRALRLHLFTIEGDWRPISKAWTEEAS
jgi:hypothetical protein